MTSENKLTALIGLSRFMRGLCIVLIVIAVLTGVVVALVGALTGASWFFDQMLLAGNSNGVPFSPDLVGLGTRILIIAVNGITVFFMCRGLWFLMNLFSAFSQQEILTLRTSQLLRQAGSSFLIVAIYGVVARTVSILLLTMNNPAGQKQLSIGLGSEQLFAILLAGTLFAIGHVLSIAAEIDEENKGFV